VPASAAIARRLGGPRARRQRHVRFAIGAAALLVIGLGLIAVDSRDDDELDDDATALCTEFAARVQDEFELSFPEGVPSDAAFAEYASHAFADTMDELLDELTAIEPPGAVADIIAGYRSVLADLRARPEDFVTENPFAALAAEFDAEGLPACGSGFFTPAAAPE
jgi:hypothetical protein